MEPYLQNSCNEGLTNTIDLNLSPTDPSNFSGHTMDLLIGFNDGIKAERLCDTGKRCISGFRIDLNEEIPDPSVVLKLSSYTEDKTVHGSITPSPTVQPHNMFMKQNLDETVEELASFVCMGCVHCYMYIVVSKSAPECPKCKSIDLLDFTCSDNPMKKKARRN